MKINSLKQIITVSAFLVGGASVAQAAYDPAWKKSQCDSYSYHGLWERYVFGGGLGWIDNNSWDSSSTEGVDCSSYVNRCWAITGYIGEHTSASHGYATSDYYPGSVPNTVRITSQSSIQPWDIFVWHSGGAGHTGLMTSIGSSSVTTREAHCTACGVEALTRSKQSLTDNASRYYRRQNWGSETPPPAGSLNGARIEGDFNGDGKDDVVMAYDYGNATTKLWVALSSGSGFGSAGVWWTSTSFTSSKAQYIAGDFTGDGKADVAALYDYGNGTSKVFIMPSTGSGFGTAAIWWASAAGDWNATSSKMIGGDFNGDGKTDLAMAYNYGNSWTKVWVWLSSGSGFTLSGVWYDSGEGNFNWNSAKFLGGDFDGDGKGDFLASYYYGSSSTKFWVARSTGTTFTGIVNWWSSTTWDDTKAKYVSGDFNADGKTDIMGAFDYGNSTAKFWGWLSAGTTFAPTSVWMTSTTWTQANAKYVAGDFTGDGKADMTALYNYGGSTSKFWTWPSSGTTFPSTSVWWSSTTWTWTAATPF